MSDSNLDDVMNQLNRFVKSFDFTRAGIEESMGKDCAHAVAERIAEAAAADQETTDGEKFPTNDPGYAEFKDEYYNVAPPAYGFRTGQMLSIASLLGETEIEPDQVTMQYGLDEPPSRSSASSYISAADKKVTDRQKARFQHDAMKKFYKPGKKGREAVIEVVKDALDRAIAEENGG